MTQCREFVRISDDLFDGWELISCDDDTYLRKRHKLAVPCASFPNSRDEAETEAKIAEVDDEDTCGVNLDSFLISLEYHVLYNEAYNVPVLFFNAWWSEGSLLTVEEVWSMTGVPATTDRWSFVTQRDHPILAGPWYEVHPCKTADLMKLSVRPEKYIVSWLSFIGQDVGITLSSEYVRT